ncbi:MAG: hypothetical protein ABMA26_19775, partial [Limisphaerales bacterium]
MKPLRKIAFVLEDFALQTPVQQLLDRFLLGYRRNAAFHKLDGVRISAARAGGFQPPPSASDPLRTRASEAALQLADFPAAVREADALVIVPKRDAIAPVEASLTAALPHAKRGAACFVVGALATTLAAART